MKKLLSLILTAVMLYPSFTLAVECITKTNATQAQQINRVCNDVSDIICKDVKKDERRSCSESDETIFNKNTTKTDLFNFAKGCFKSGVTSFAQFFTDFLPELLKGIWDASKAGYSLVNKSLTSDEPGLWSKIKGMYESTASVAADVYEAVQENPGAYFDKIWSKVIDVVGPLVSNYDCLKPQYKVEKICGFVGEWVVPPAMLAKILVRGVKEVKFLKETGAFSATASGKLAKALEYSEKRSLLSLKQLQTMEGQFKTLGYTRDEFALLYKAGALEKIKVSELKSLTTAEGRAQKAKLLGEGSPKAAVAVAILQKTTTKPVKAVQQKTVQDNSLDDLRSMEVTETDFAAFEAAQKTQNQVTGMPKKVNSTPAKPVKVEGMDVNEIGMDDFQLAQEAQNAAALKSKAEKASRENAAYLADQERIKQQGEVQHNGMGVEEIAHDDPRYIEMFGGGKPLKPQYDNGVNYVDSKFKGTIVKSKDKPKTVTKALDEKSITGVFKSNYIQVMTKDSTGITTYMSAQVIKKVRENNTEKYVIRMLDKASNSYKEKTVSLFELKNIMKAKESPKVEKELLEFNRQTGFQEGLFQ